MVRVHRHPCLIRLGLSKNATLNGNNFSARVSNVKLPHDTTLLSLCPTSYLPIAPAAVNKKVGHASSHLAVQSCARSCAKCMRFVTHERNCEMINTFGHN